MNYYYCRSVFQEKKQNVRRDFDSEGRLRIRMRCENLQQSENHTKNRENEINSLFSSVLFLLFSQLLLFLTKFSRNKEWKYWFDTLPICMFKIFLFSFLIFRSKFGHECRCFCSDCAMCVLYEFPCQWFCNFRIFLRFQCRYLYKLHQIML